MHFGYNTILYLSLAGHGANLDGRSIKEKKERE